MNFDNNPKIDAINEFISNRKRKLSKIDLKALSVNGKCLNEPMSDYLARKAIQSTNIKECSYSPKDFLESYNSTKNTEQTDAMHLGTFAHSAILEPELLTNLRDLIDSITSHQDYTSGEEGDQWHDLISKLQDNLNEILNKEE